MCFALINTVRHAPAPTSRSNITRHMPASAPRSEKVPKSWCESVAKAAGGRARHSRESKAQQREYGTAEGEHDAAEGEHDAAEGRDFCKSAINNCFLRHGLN